MLAGVFLIQSHTERAEIFPQHLKTSPRWRPRTDLLEIGVMYTLRRNSQSLAGSRKGLKSLRAILAGFLNPGEQRSNVVESQRPMPATARIGAVNVLYMPSRPAEFFRWPVKKLLRGFFDDRHQLRRGFKQSQALFSAQSTIARWGRHGSARP